MKHMANGAATKAAEQPRTIQFPGLANIAKEPKQPVEFSWAQRRLLELGVLLMPDSPTKPPGFYINFSTITFIILVVGSIAGLWWFTWQKAEMTGYERGRQEVEMKQMNERILKAEENERRRVLLEATRTGSQAGHEKEPERK